MTVNHQHKKKTSFGHTLIPMVWTLFVFVLAGFAVYAGIYMERNTVIHDVTFTGNYFTSENSLFKAIDSPVGLYADSIDYRSIFADIKELPYINDVIVNMTRRGVLQFRVMEHEPIALLADGSYRAYVSEGGIKLPIKYGKAKNVPLLYGFPATPITDTLKTEAFRHVETFLTAAKQSRIGWITISEISWNDREGVVALTHENGVTLVFGKDNFEEKIAHWEAFYTDVIMIKGIKQFTRIDLRFRDQIVTQKL